MPSIRSSILECYTLFTLSISLNREIISSYFYYAKKGLIYIIIIAPSSYSPFFYLKYTKANTYLLCDMRSVSINKYTFSYYCTYLYTYYSFLVLYLSYYRVLSLIYC